MKKILSITFFLTLVTTSWCQYFIDPANKSFEEIKAEGESYYQEMALQRGATYNQSEGSHYSRFLQWIEFWEGRIDDEGSLESYYKAYQTVVNSGEYGFGQNSLTKTNSDPWTEIGPVRAPEYGQQDGSNGGTKAGIGPVEFIDVYRFDTEKLICGSQKGGLFYTTNGGDSWQNAGSDDWVHSPCKTAAIHPSNFNIWYASSNLANSDNSMGFTGGVMRTNDMGASWTQIGDINDMSLGLYTDVKKLEVDPVNGIKVFYATSDGLRYTNDASASSVTWLSPSGMNGFPIEDVEFKANSQTHIFAAVDNNGLKLMESLNGGITWSLVSGQPSNSGVTNMTIETTTYNYNELYCLLQKDDNPTSEIWKYNMNTLVWTLISNNHTVTFSGGHGFGVSNTDPDILAVCQYDRYKTKIGTSWTTYTSSSSNKYQYHVDVEDLLFDYTNNGRIWMAHHGGVSMSEDNGATWIDRSEGLGVCEVYGMDISMNNADYVIIGAYHDGTVVTRTSYGPGWNPEWDHIKTGDGLHPSIDYSDPNHMWYASQGGGSIVYSDDAGANVLSSASSGSQEDWNNWVKLNSEDPTIVYSSKIEPGVNPMETEVVRSTDRGKINTYEIISDFATTHALTDGYRLRQIETTLANSDWIYARVIDTLTGLDYLFRTKQANNTNLTTVINSWELLNIPNINNFIVSFKVDQENPDIVYLIHHSDIGGTWSQAQGTDIIFKMDYSLLPTDPNHQINLTHNLPNVGVGDIDVERFTNGGVYIGTDVGVFFLNQDRIDNGSYWYQMDGLPHIPVSHLIINYEINRVRIGMRGRGVWEHHLYCPDQYSQTENGTYTTDKFIETEHTITSTAQIPSPIKVTYRAGYQISLNPGFSAYPGSDFKAMIHGCDVPGNSFKTQEELYNENEESIELTKTPQLYDIRLYPNPSNGIFNLELLNGIETAEIAIYSVNGKQILQKMMTSPLEQIDLSSFQNGLYLLVANVNNRKVTIKLMKR